MTPEIRSIESKILVGLHMTMNLIQNKTPELWRTFMQRRNELTHRISNDLFSLQIYPVNYFSAFNPNTDFVKWAAAEVSDDVIIPEGMDTMALSGGTYAVFEHKGSNDPAAVFRFIYTEWLPGSGYQLDNRPHFEVLGANYKNNDPASEEEIWIPIR